MCDLEGFIYCQGNCPRGIRSARNGIGNFAGVVGVDFAGVAVVVGIDFGVVDFAGVAVVVARYFGFVGVDFVFVARYFGFIDPYFNNYKSHSS